MSDTHDYRNSGVALQKIILYNMIWYAVMGGQIMENERNHTNGI